MRLIVLFILLSLGAEASNAQIIRANAFYRPVGGTQFLLDAYPNAAAAYSLRKINSSYTGNCIEVRRSSDNTTSNIGFLSSGELDTSALKTFVGANSGFIRTWYDQSGNTRNATQTTNANQPRIINLGTIERINGKPCIRWSANTMRLSSYKFAAPSTNWIIINIASINDVGANNNNNVFGTDGNGYQSNGIYLQGRDNNSGLFVNRTSAVSGSASGSLINNTQFFTAHQYLSTDSAQSYTNNNISSKVSMLMSGNKFTSGDQTVYWIGAARQSNNFLASQSLLGTIQEHIIYQSDQTSNMSGIKTNINNYYGIW